MKQHTTHHLLKMEVHLITNVRISIIPYPAVLTPYISSQVEPSSTTEEKTIQYVSLFQINNGMKPVIIMQSFILMEFLHYTLGFRPKFSKGI